MPTTMPTTTTRVVAVAAGTLILCLTGGGFATAAMVPSPSTPSAATLDSVPPPGDIVKQVEDTATGVVDKVTTIAGQPGKTPNSAPKRQPTVTHPALHRLVRPAHSAPAAQPSLASWSLPAGASMSAGLLGLPTTAAPDVRTPTVAARLTSVAPAQQAADAASSSSIDERTGGVLRGVLIALSAAAAAALGMGHVSVARSR